MYHNVKSKTDLSSLYMVYRVGTRQEPEYHKGIRHHVEHVMCERLKELEDAMTAEGVDFNAYTCENNVVFYMEGLERKIANWRQKFIENILSYIPTQEVIDREREIIVEEYKQTFAESVAKQYYNVMRKYYNNYGAIGEISDIKTFTADKLLPYYEKYFRKPNCIISVSKNFKFDAKFMKIDFADITVGEDNGCNDLKIEPVSNPDNQSNYTLISKEPIVENQSYLKLICWMLSMGLNAPFMQEMREKRKLTYGIATDRVQLGDNGIIFMNMPTSTSKLVEGEKAFKYVLNNPKKFMTKERFDLVKGYLEVMQEKKQWTTSNINHILNSKNWNLDPKDFNYDIAMDMYNQHFKFNKFNVSIDTEDFK